MTYSPLIPSPASSPKDSAAPIQVNFSQFASIFSTGTGVVYNHYPLNDNQQGKHGSVIFDQISDPTVNLTLCSLYAKNTISAVTPSGQPQLYARIKQFLPNGTPNFPMQLTYNTVNIAGPQYQSFVVGGYIVYIGSIQPTFPTPPPVPPRFTITLSPTPSSIVCVQAVSQYIVPNSGVGVTISNVTASTFIINTPLYQNTFTYYWMAIGKQ
jgi:hypothetical protein